MNELSAEYIKAAELDRRIKTSAQLAQQSLYDMCMGFKEMRDSRLYKELGYSDFGEYCEQETGFSRMNVYNYIRVAEKLPQDFVNSSLQIGVKKLTLLAKLSDEERTELAENIDLESTTVKELKAKIDILQNERDRAMESNAEASHQVFMADKKVLEMKNRVTQLEAEIKELESRPIEVAVETDSKEVANLKDAMRRVDLDWSEKYSKLEEDSLKDRRELLQKAEQAEKDKQDKLSQLREELDRTKAEYEKKLAGKVDAAPMQDDMPTILQNIREKLIAGVEKRLDADAPVGFLLSGGLDSSLVCSIAAKKLGKPIRTFAIGMDTDAIDLKYARQTADYLGSEHHEIIINREMVLSSLEEVIRLLGTWDITTIRASMGMYLLCKAIHEQTDVRVLLTGEISDELFGYKYTDYAPTADAFQQESQKRIRELYMYDVLRADRCISSNSIEARVPFGDLDFVRYVMAIDPEKKLNRYGKGKYLLRKAFDGDWLPPEILWREKAAFSDAVGHSMVDDIKEYAEGLYTEEEFQMRRANYSAHCMPFTKESLFYREIFEKYYHDQSRTIVGFWMPNKAWPGCNVNDPSARVLANYGASGV